MSSSSSQNHVARSSQQHNSMICSCIEQNKNYLIQSLTHEINEIIRILQLTSSCDDDEWMSDEQTLVKQKLVRFFFFNFKIYFYKI